LAPRVSSSSVLKHAITRPLKLLVLSPIVLALAIFQGLFFLVVCTSSSQPLARSPPNNIIGTRAQMDSAFLAWASVCVFPWSSSARSPIES
jgi:hypothetical protein